MAEKRRQSAGEVSSVAYKKMSQSAREGSSVQPKISFSVQVKCGRSNPKKAPVDSISVQGGTQKSALVGRRIYEAGSKKISSVYMRRFGGESQILASVCRRSVESGKSRNDASVLVKYPGWNPKKKSVCRKCFEGGSKKMTLVCTRIFEGGTQKSSTVCRRIDEACKQKMVSVCL
jgi:hypothetical protein